MAKKALGKGIDALFAGDRSVRKEEPRIQEPAETASNTRTIDIGLDEVRMDPGQPRKRFDEVSIHELADSITRHGVLQPIIVRPEADGKYAIVAGERRYRAARLAGIATIPATVRSLDDKGRLQIALVENLQREDLSPIEEARAYQELMDVADVGQEQVAETVGKSRSTVANSLRLLKLSGDAQDAVGRGEISPGHARALLSVTNPADRKTLFDRMRSSPMSVREAEDAAARANSGSRGRGKPGRLPESAPRDANVADVEERLLDRFSTKVRIRMSGEGGRVEIHYYSADDLERILELLLGD